MFLAPSVGHNAAVAIAAVRPEGCVAVRVEHLEAEEGRSIRSKTEDLIVELCDRYAVEAVACDLRGFRRPVEILEARGVPVLEAPHTTPRLVEFSATLDALMAEGKLMHDGDPITRAQMLAALKKTNETGERYIPSDAARAVIAVVSAVHHATALVDEIYIILPTGVG